MTFPITPDECNRLIRSYQTEAANRPRVLSDENYERELLANWRGRIQELTMHAAFLRSSTQFGKPGIALVTTGDTVRVGTKDKEPSLFQRGISARVLQGVKLCDKCMRQLPQCVCHQSNVRGE